MSNCICINTKALLGTTGIPPGTESVVVEQFDTSSALSAALYIPVASDPHHPLAVLNTIAVPNQWWAIHPDYLTLEAAGAPPAVSGDCAGAMQNVLDYVAVVHQAKLQLWERDYFLSYAAILTQPIADSLTLNFTIQGRGKGVSRLLVPCTTVVPVQPLGAFQINYNSNMGSFIARDFSVIATNATGSTLGAGTAILANFPGVLGGAPGEHRSVIIAHVEIGNDAVHTGNVSWAYFAVGVDVTGAAHPLLFDVTIAGPDGSQAFTNIDCSDDASHPYADDSPAFLPTCHLVINGCYDPHLISLKLWNAQTGISHVTTNVPAGGQGPQGFYMSDVRFTQFKTCLVHSQTYTDETTVQCPDGMIQNCFFQFRDVGLNLTSIEQWQVSGCEFYLLGDGYNVGGDCAQGTAFDITIADATIVNISGCRFNRTSGAYSAPNRVNIQINPVATPSGGTVATHILIAHNQFGDRVSGGGPFGISAVRIYATVNDIRIGDNHYIGSYSGPVVDDGGTGAVAAMLGYPTGGSAPVGAVVPNGGTSGVNPTLGSVNVAWPASFAFAHFISQHTAPAVPSGWVGWVLYTDSSGDLLATNGSVIRTVASH